MRKLNLGCGEDYRQGFVNVDINRDVRKDKIVDIEKKLPFEDNVFNYVYIRHVLEHLEPRKLNSVMQEIHRICKKNAILEIHVPHFSCGKTFMSHDHLTFFSYFTFNKKCFQNFKMLKRKMNFMRSELPYTGNKRLNKIAKIINPIFSFIPNKIPFVYERLFCWIYPVEEISFKIRIIK